VTSLLRLKGRLHLAGSPLQQTCAPLLEEEHNSAGGGLPTTTAATSRVMDSRAGGRVGSSMTR
ncbi:hypothetical protein ACRAWF_00580, partial [Streptomyces sp. L7]